MTITQADANVAFELAIAQGRLSRDSGADNYAGDYMWMGFNPKTGDAFKNRITRKYLAPRGWAVAETSTEA